jgi:hypothetical protein
VSRPRIRFRWEQNVRRRLREIEMRGARPGCKLDNADGCSHFCGSRRPRSWHGTHQHSHLTGESGLASLGGRRYGHGGTPGGVLAERR